MPIVLALTFAVLGGWWAQWPGLLAGSVIGWLLGSVQALRARVDELDRVLAGLRAAQPPPADAVESRTAISEPAGEPAVSADASPGTASAPWPPADVPADAAAPVATAPDVFSGPPATPTRLARALDAGRAWIERYLASGNPVVKIGVVVLFIGVAFLLRYAAERVTVPVELRLTLVAAAAIVVLVIGWRLRHRPDAYGLTLQGAAVGVLYLTVFAAARLYGVVPVAAAFPLLVFVVLFSTIMAVLQNAQVLAGFALAGGFLAPVLMSTGTGSHVVLFSYYALLNAGVLAMAWFRAWRVVNWIGFMFTFVIGASWGYRYYQPAYFASTEPFLVLFFLYYVAVATLFTRPAVQQRAGGAALMDGTLLFGTPVVAFALQAALVRHLAFGLAYSALFMAAVYVALTAWLRRRRVFESLLGQSYLALGIVFASLAIPFAFDNQRWTAAAWSLEGAGLVWVGLRQQRLLPRLLGMGLQLAAGAAFMSMLGRSAEPRLLLNSVYLGCLMLGLAGLFSALQFHRQSRRQGASVRPLERRLAPAVFLTWGLVWWLAGGLRETLVNVGDRYWLEAIAGYVAASFGALTLTAIRLRWPAAARPSVATIPVVGMLILVGTAFSDSRLGDPFRDLGWLVWPPVLMLIWHDLYLAERHHVWRRRVLSAAHAAALAVLTLWLGWMLDSGIAALTRGQTAPVWHQLAWGLVPAVLMIAPARLRRRLDWPLGRYAEAYLGLGLVPVAVLLVIWLASTGTAAGDPAPLGYLPLLNPLELVQLAGLLALYDWTARQRGARLDPFVPALELATAAAAFYWLNTAAARAVHYLGGIDYPLGHIAGSAVFQATISILWTLLALAAMVLGSRRPSRRIWIGGAALLAVVTVKLFLVDLSGIGTVARIVSFVSVGVLMLVIGFLAPLPPKDRMDKDGVEQPATELEHV